MFALFIRLSNFGAFAVRAIYIYIYIMFICVSI